MNRSSQLDILINEQSFLATSRLRSSLSGTAATAPGSPWPFSVSRRISPLPLQHSQRKTLLRPGYTVSYFLMTIVFGDNIDPQCLLENSVCPCTSFLSCQFNFNCVSALHAEIGVHRSCSRWVSCGRCVSCAVKSY